MNDKYLSKDGIIEKYDSRKGIINCFKNIGIVVGCVSVVLGVGSKSVGDLATGGVLAISSYTLGNYISKRNEKKKEKELNNIEKRVISD